MPEIIHSPESQSVSFASAYPSHTEMHSVTDSGYVPDSREEIRPVGPRSLVDAVEKELRRAIIRGQLRPGSVFSVTDLSSSLDVSHIPVREALQRLETQGLVELRRGKSRLIAPVTEAELAEIYRLREILECPLAKGSVGRYSANDIERLASFLAEMENSGPNPDDRFWDAHYTFHRTLLRPAIGPWANRVLDPLWRGAERYHRLFLRTRLDVVGAMEDHRILLDEARNSGVQLTVTLRQHLRRNMGGIRSGLRASAALKDKPSS